MTITEYIRRDIESRISTADNLPAKLTLSDLAKEYGVSLTPVRDAIEMLKADGLIIQQDNRRLLVNPNKIGKPLGEGHRPEPPRDWESVLMEYVFVESLQGAQEFIREEALAERFGIGRTILRQVFSQLAGNGFLIHERRRGWRVKPLSEIDLQDYLVVRETLEIKAFRLARPRIDRQRIEEMLEGNHPGSDQQPRLDNHLHGYFIELSQNRYLQEFFQRYGKFYHPLFDYAALGASVIEEMAAQHCRILQNVLDGNWDSAEAALSEHILAQYPIVQRVMETLSDPDERDTRQA